MSTLKVTNIKAADGISALSIANSSGNVTVETGKVFAPNGIVFSSTELTTDDASTTTRTESSNLLDDYEEGTWTPTFQNGWAGTSEYKAYTKIGRQVTVQAKILIDTEAAAPIKIGGLPFNVNSSYTGAVSCVMIHYLQGVNYSQVHAYAIATTDTFSLYGNNTMGNWTPIDSGDTTTNTEFYVTLTYMTT